jgi:hypothetical protein
MLTAQLKMHLESIKHNRWDDAIQAYVEQLSAKDLVAELLTDYPIVFQKRQIGRKEEIGLAKEVVYELRSRKLPNSLFSGMYVLPTLRHCFLISSYDDAVSGITWTRRIYVKPTKQPNKSVAIFFGSGIKVDKTVDGWSRTALRKGGAPLSDQVLKNRGWQFDVFQPFGFHGSTTSP